MMARDSLKNNAGALINQLKIQTCPYSGLGLTIVRQIIHAHGG